MITAAPNAKLLEEKQDNRKNILYNIWEKQTVNEFNINAEQLINVVINKMREATDVVCLSSNAPLPREILQEIPKLSQKGIRVYLVLSEFDELYTSFINNKALVRIDKQVVGNILLIDPNLITRNGYLFAFNSFKYAENSINFYVPFDGIQLKEAYHYFLNVFWLSMEEYREGKINSSFQNLKPPFDIFPLIDPEGFYYNNKDTKYLNSQIEQIILNAQANLYIGFSEYSELNSFCSIISLKAMQGVSVTIFTSLDFKHDYIRDLCAIDNIVVKALKELNNFFVLADNQKGFLLSGSLNSQNEVGIPLSSNIVQGFIKRLELLQPNMWLFHKEIYLGDLKSGIVYEDSFNQQLIQKEIDENTIIDYGEITAPTLRDFYEGTYKPTKKDTGKLVKIITHRWKLVPQKLDSNAKEDPLYEQWEKELTKLKNYVNNVLEYAKTVRNEKKVVLSSFFGNIFRKEDKLDIDRIISRLESAIIEMENGKFKWSNVGELLEVIKEYTSKLLEHQLELKEKQEFYEKKQEWEKSKDELNNKYHERLSALEPLIFEKKKLEKSIQEINPELQDEISLYNMEISSIEEKISLMVAEEQEVFDLKRVNDVVLAVCENLNHKIKNYQKLSKGARKKYFANKVQPYLNEQFESIGQTNILNSILESNSIKDAKEKMICIKKEIALNKELRIEIPTDKINVLNQYETLCKEKNKLVLGLEELKRIDSENKVNERLQLQKIEKDVTKLERELQQIEKGLRELGEEFTYISSKKHTQKLPFSVRVSLVLPKEDLPSVGRLYILGKTRKLAISNQEQIDIGEEEAKRLKADLVLK